MDSRFDIAPFALPNCERGEIRFEEPRDIACVRVRLPRGGQRPRLQYLQSHWPNQRLGGGIETFPYMERPFRFGWFPIDDHFNAKWREAAIRTAPVGDAMDIRFAPLSAEFPDCAGTYDVRFRRALGIRIDTSGAETPGISGVFTTSTPVRTRLRVTLDAGIRTPTKEIAIDGYNSVIGPLRALSGARTSGRRARLGQARHRSIEFGVRHQAPAHRFCNDDGHVRFILDRDAVTISLAALAEEGPIWSPETGLFITQADDPTTFAEYRQRNQASKCIRTMVRERPEEQSYSGAFLGQPRHHLQNVAFCCGVKYARQGFRIMAEGDVVLDFFNVSDPGDSYPHGKGAARDTARFRNEFPVKLSRTHGARFFFGLCDWVITRQATDPVPTMAYNVEARWGDLLVEEKVFAVPLLQSILKGELPRSDDPVAVLVRLRFANRGIGPLTARLPLRYSSWIGRHERRASDPAWLERLQIKGRRIMGTYNGMPVLRCTYESNMEAVETPSGVDFHKELAAEETCELLLRIPFIALESEEELQALDALDFARCYEEMTAFWRAEAPQGARIVTPEPAINELYAVHLSHLMISDYALPETPNLINVPSGTSTYGSPANETTLMTHDLDERNLAGEARRRLGVWLKYQGTSRLLGTYTDCEGVFHGAGGFEHSRAYNQDHGWIMWALAEHYRFTQDREWFGAVAEALIAGCDWVLRQRRHTMRALPHSRGWEHGFLPAGALEDVTDYHYWLVNNVIFWWGSHHAALALETFGHPEARRVRQEVDAFKADVVRGLEIQRQHTPLVRLRDGRWVPRYPTRLYLRGRDYGWVREVYEGSLFLLITGLYDARGKEAEWILDDLHDNLYGRPPYGYRIVDFETNWFAQAGFCMEPNYFPDVLPFLDRDEPEIYVWMFFNKWAAVFVPEVVGMAEHAAPVLGWLNSAIYKTSEESGAMMWLRSMYVYARPDILHFGRALPRAWLSPGNDIQAADVATRHGRVSVRYVCEEGRITASVALDLRENPARILVRFRHPRRQPLRAVTVDGAAWTRFDAVGGDVDITGCRNQVRVVAQY